MYAGKF